MKISMIFDNFGPYHIARLNALSRQCNLFAIEMFGASNEYQWPAEESVSFRRITVEPKEKNSFVDHPNLSTILSTEAPDVVFVPGWSSRSALQALAWAVSKGVPAVVMSDSQLIDFERRKWLESIKFWVVGKFSAALVAGTPHAEYASCLGIRKELIRKGYDAIDNDYFAAAAVRARADAVNYQAKLDLPRNYFLVVARLIPKKNHLGILQAYALYRAQVLPEFLWDLVFVGDGPMRAEIDREIRDLKLMESVWMKGFLPYWETAEVLGLAKALVLPSLVEQWGLVVNEAMAASIPVLVSNRCGSAMDLVLEGETGFSFNPYDNEGLARLLVQFAQAPEEQRLEMGDCANQKIQDFSLENFVESCIDISKSVSLNTKSRQIVGIALNILARTRGRN